MSKYDPLREHLARLDDVVWAAKLGDVESILGSNLPRSAREHRTWWANSGGSLVHQNAWLDAGWRVERTDLMRDVVVFRRLRIGGTPLASRKAADKGRSGDRRTDAEKQLAGAMAALRQPVTVTLRAEWTTLGDVNKVPCSAATVPTGCGILRIATLVDGDPKCRLLPTGSIQTTYRDLKMAMKRDDDSATEQLLARYGVARGMPVECDFVKPGNAWLLTDGRGRKADLDNTGERALIAQLLYLQEIQSGRSATLIAE
jgi:hypothetical protein